MTPATPLSRSIQKQVFPRPAQARLPALRPPSTGSVETIKPSPPFLDHAGKKLRIIRQVWDRSFERLHIEVADCIRGHQSHRFRLEYRAPIGTTFIHEDTLEAKVIGCRAVESAASHLEFRLLRHFELYWSKRAIRTPRVHACQPGAALGCQLEGIASELRRLADGLQRLQQYRRDEHEALQPILRRLVAIERALGLREKIEAPRASWRRPLGQ